MQAEINQSHENVESRGFRKSHPVAAAIPEAVVAAFPRLVSPGSAKTKSRDDGWWRLLGVSDQTFKLSRRAAALIILYGATLLLLNPGARWSIDTHEMLYAQSAREMVASGHWMIPTLVGLPRVEKPPLTSWLIGLAIKLFDRQSEWVARLPSVVAAIVAALIIAHFSARFFGATTGLVTGLIQLSSVWVLIVAEQAVPDMMLCVTVSGAWCAFGQANVDGPMNRDSRLRLRWLFYLSAGLAFLAKGPIGPVLVFLPAFIFLAWERDLERMRFFWSPVGISLFLACLLVWPLVVISRFTPSVGIWTEENLGRFMGSLGDTSPLIYFYTLPWFTLPWIPAVVLGAIAITRLRPVAPVWRLLGIWFGFGFVALSLSRYRLYYYLVPILPPLSAIAAVGLLHFCSDDRYHTRSSLRVAVALVVLAFAVGITTADFILPPGVVLRALKPALILAAGLLATLYFTAQGRVAPQLFVVFVALWIATMLAQGWVVEGLDPYAEQTRFAREVEQSMPRDRTLILMYLLPMWHEQMFFYLPPRLVWSTDPFQLREKLLSDQDGEIYLLAPEGLAGILGPIGDVRILRVSPFVNSFSGKSSRLVLLMIKRKLDGSAVAMEEHNLPSPTAADIFPESWGRGSSVANQ